MPDDSQRNPGAEIPNTNQAWIHESRGAFLSVQARGEGDCRLLDHAVRDVARFGEDRAEANAGEDIHVVPLASFKFHTIAHHGLVRAT